MAEYLSKTSIQTPAKRLRDFDLSCQHVTTQTFMRPSIAYAKEFFASKDSGTKIMVNLKTYSRLDPMLRPTLGSIQIRNRAFFVPFRLVWSSFNEMLEAVPIANPEGGSVILSGVPYFSYEILLNTIYQQGDYVEFLTPQQVSDGAQFDFRVSGDHYRLLPKGRQALKILESLGYHFQLGIDYNSTILNAWKQNPVYFSFLPLLCAAKVFVDWYYPAQYAHSGEYINIDGILQRRLQYEASVLDVWSCLEVLQWVYYDNDYFTAQWDTPVAPAPGVFDSVAIPDITNMESGHVFQSVTNNGSLVAGPQNSAYKPSNGTPFVGSSAAGSSSGTGAAVVTGVFTQYLDTALKKLTNAVKRHQLVGARVIDRMLADYGVVTNWERMKRSYYLGSQVFPVQISDVMSNSDTQSDSGDGSVLGQYAGKGLAYDGSGNFEFETNEFGMFMVFNSVVPDVGYYNQFDRQVLHKTRMDFYNPNYDALGVQAISKAEVYAINPVTDFTEIFGYLPMYSDYKCGFDRVSGAYLYPSTKGGLSPWLTMRNLSHYVDWSGTPLGQSINAHSIYFMKGNDAAQYCRLFYGFNGEEFDPFYIVHRINVKASMGASPMYDSYEFDEKEGDMITMQANGSQLN